MNLTEDEQAYVSEAIRAVIRNGRHTRPLRDVIRDAEAQALHELGHEVTR